MPPARPLPPSELPRDGHPRSETRCPLGSDGPDAAPPTGRRAGRRTRAWTGARGLASVNGEGPGGEGPTAASRPRPRRRRLPAAASQPAPEAQEAALRAGLPGRRGARHRLVDLRDHDGGRGRPARSSRTGPSSSTPRTRSCYDLNGEKIATLTSNERRILVDSADIAPMVKQAVVAIEDQRFYEHRGIDYQGIGRAVFQDVLPQRRPRVRRRSPSSSSRTRSGRRAAAPCSRSSARRRWPTSSSATGPRTRSSPST